MKKIIFIVGLLILCLTAEGQKFGIGAVSDTGFIRVLSSGRTTALTATQMAALFGGGSIADNSVTFAKMQDIGTDRLIGRDAAGTGDPAEISLNSTLEWTGSNSIQRAALTGDITATAGSNTTDIAAGVIVNADINASAGIALSKLATQTALSVVTNATNSTAVPTAVAAANDGEVFRRSGTSLAFGTVATAGIADGAVTNVKIADVAASKLTSGTLPSSFAFGTTASSTARTNYSGGNPSFITSNNANESSIFSQDGEQYLTVNNTSAAIGSGASKVEFTDGVLALFDSDATNKVSIQTPATGTLTTNYTLTLPADDGTANQVLTTNGTGTLSWTTPSGGGGSPSVVTFSQFTSDQNNITTSGLSSATVVRVSGDDGIRTITSISSTGMSDGWAFRMVNVGSQPLILAAQHPSASANNGFLADKDVVLPAKHFVSLIWDSTSGGFVISPSVTNESGKIFSIYSSPTSATAGDNPFITYTTASGSVTGLAATSDNPGAWQASTLTSTTGAAAITMGKSGSLGLGHYGSSYIYYEAIVSIPTLSDGTNTFFATHMMRNNVGISASNAPSQAIQIAYSHGENSGKWFATTRAAGSTTTVDLGVTVVDKVTYHLLIAINKQATEARFYIDGVYRGRSTTNLPTTSAVLFGNTGIGKTAGATARTFLVNKVGLSHIYAN